MEKGGGVERVARPSVSPRSTSMLPHSQEGGLVGGGVHDNSEEGPHSSLQRLRS